MGEHDRWAEPPSGLLPNGLLPNEAASVIRGLDSERWSKAEERTAELIACIQPNQPSEERRNAVADYVQRLIMKCFPCQVFTFGSVPLKTYLPDGDIDLTAFCKNQSLKDGWAHQVRDMLEHEEKNENAEFRVKEVQYIQAEVKIIKCLVENIVVDISFNQLGGLCTLCFLEEVDNLINQNHLFKRSIILIKAWCYYESRILGAHHGLISTYALETLVLYIFHVFNNSFAGPLEVLYRFLEFFSKFDWDNFCVSLWGPVPISSLPDVTAEPPRKDAGELLLSKLFLEACSSVYAVFPSGQENQGQPFPSKHFNVIDPLRINNNLGRSVSKGNFFRIRSAFAFGAKKLARLLNCPEDDLSYEVNQFFMNTWERHGSGHRPDAPRNDLWQMRPSNPHQSHSSENHQNNSSSKSSGHEAQADSHPFEGTSRNSEAATVSRPQSNKTHVEPKSTRTSEHTKNETTSTQGMLVDRSYRSPKADSLVGNPQGRYLFARTRSSPELTDTYGENSTHGKHSRAIEVGKGQNSSSRLDSSSRKNLESDNMANPSIRPNDDPSSVRLTMSHHNNDASANSNKASNIYLDDSTLGSMGEEFASVLGSQRMLQEEQDLINVMATSGGLGFNGQVHVPLNMASSHIPFPIPPSVLASMGYTHRNLGGMLPTNIPLDTPWATNMHFPQGLVPSPLSHYFPGMGLASNPEDSNELGNENFGSTEMNRREADHDVWHDQERGAAAAFHLDNGSFEMPRSDDKQPTSSDHKFAPSSRVSASGNSFRNQQKLTKEPRGLVREDHTDAGVYQENRGSEEYYDDRIASSRSSSNMHAGSLRSKTSSESSWEGSPARISKPLKEKRGRKISSTIPSTVYGKVKSTSESSSIVAEDDDKEWNLLPTTGSEMTERSIDPQSTASLHASRHQIPGFELAQTSGSQSLMPFGPMLLNPGSRQRSTDNPDAVPFAFYPTGPPVPFVMLPMPFPFPSEAGNFDASTSKFSNDEGLDNSDSGQNFDSSEGFDQSDVLSPSRAIQMAASIEPLDHKPDILNSDFVSHWQNLQYGRLCQNTRHAPPLSYPSPVMVPPVYLQGRFPWDGPGRPLSNNVNHFTQLTSYGPRVVPVAPLQSVSGRPSGAYNHFDEVPRYRSGTGTYLPNPKVSPRDRHFTNTRKGNYNYNRSDHYGDREGNWNINSKTRAAGRSRSQSDKSNSRPDRLALNESRADRSWGSHRHDSFPSYHSQNGPIHSNAAQSGSTNMTYGMYPLPTMNPSGASNGPTMPSVVMVYHYDHNTGYGSTAEQLEFGSLGPVGFSGVNEILQLNEVSRSSGGFEDQRFHGNSGKQSSPDQPSSPHHRRKFDLYYQTGGSGVSSNDEDINLTRPTAKDLTLVEAMMADPSISKLSGGDSSWLCDCLYIRSHSPIGPCTRM